MKVSARHERDDQTHVLDADQITELEKELGFSLQQLIAGGVYGFETRDGWAYRLEISF